jgi:hypothetical protein
MAGEGKFIDNLMNGDLVVTGDVDANTIVDRGDKKYVKLNFNTHPIYKGKVLADGTTLAHAAPTGATGDENLMIFPECTLEWHVIVTQTILAPALTATGLNIAMDQTGNDGIEVCTGILTNNRYAFTVGGPAFYAKMKFSLADVSGTDDCAFGFRKAEAYQAAIDDYADMAAMNVISGDIKIETILAGATTVTTDTTKNWADTETHELGVFVSSGGVVTYTIDGAPPATTAAYTFTAAAVVVPFFYYLHDSDVCDTVILKTLEIGYQ